MGWIPQIGRNCLPIPVRGGIKARTERYADRVRIIRATAARDEGRHKAAGETGTATETEAAGKNISTEKSGARYLIGSII